MDYIFNKYLKYLTRQKDRPVNTIKSYSKDLKNFSNYISTAGAQEITDVDSEMITDYLDFLRSAGRATSTVSRNLSAIRNFFKYALKRGFVKQNPTVDVKAPRVLKKKPSILSEEEIDLLMKQPDYKNFKGYRDKAMLELLYATGIKVSELINLKKEDIDFENSTIKCITSKGHRHIPLGDVAKNALKDYIRKVSTELPSVQENELLFLNFKGEQMTRQGFWKIIKTYKIKANIKTEITPYTIRHSFATHLFQNGADLKSIQKLLGHSDISSTQKYASLNDGRLETIYKRTHPRAKVEDDDE
jgi:integrase/recombinase XerD